MHKKIFCKIFVSNYLSNFKYGFHLCGKNGKIHPLCQKSEGHTNYIRKINTIFARTMKTRAYPVY